MTAEICAVSSSAGQNLHDPKQTQESQNHSNIHTGLDYSEEFC